MNRTKQRPPECVGCILEPSHKDHDPRYHGVFVAPYCTCEAHQRAETGNLFDILLAGCTARLIAIGMAPGPEETRAGRPLVGPAGRKWQAALAWATQAQELEGDMPVMTLNLVQCRTQQPGISRDIVNRDPSAKEIRSCAKRFLAPLLRRVTDDVVIVPLGQLAAKHLFPQGIKYNETVNNRVHFSKAEVLRVLTGDDE